MQINVRLSSGIAAKIGQAHLALTLPEGATVADAGKMLSADYPGAADLLARAVVMTDGRHAGADEALAPGQSLAYLIPIAGGQEQILSLQTFQA